MTKIPMTPADLAELLQLTTRRVNQLATETGARLNGSTVNAAPIIAAHVRRLSERAATGDARRELMAAQLERTRLETQTKRQELVPVEAVMELVALFEDTSYRWQTRAESVLFYSLGAVPEAIRRSAMTTAGLTSRDDVKRTAESLREALRRYLDRRIAAWSPLDVATD